METRAGNRLLPQSMLSTHSPPAGRTQPQKVVLRRRCRSECLQMSPVIGIPTQPKQFDDLTEFVRRKAPYYHHPAEHHDQQQPSLPQQQNYLPQTPSPVFRSTLKKFPPSPILRNQESAKNIFSFVDTRRNVSAALLKQKENISSAPSLIHTTTTTTATDSSPIDFLNGDVSMRKFEQYREQAARTNHHFINKYQCIEKDNPFEIDVGAVDPTSRMFNRLAKARRVRARSESEPHEIYQSKESPNKMDKCRLYESVLKRSREDKSQHLLRSGHQQSEKVPDFIDHNNTTSDAIKTSESIPLPLKVVENPNYTKIVSNHLPTRPSTPRYPVNKQLNGRKLKSRNSILRNKQVSKTMVVSIPTVPQVATTAATTAEDDGHATKTNADEDSDSSSLEDDDDFGDLGEGDYNDSMSDSEDGGSFTTSHFATSAHEKLSDTTLVEADCVVGKYTTTAPLSPSLFPHVPPYISFATHSEKGPPMPAAITKVLKWKLTTITPIVIRKVLLNSGFRLLRNDDKAEQQSDDDETNDWMGVWGKHMKSPCFKTVRSYQKINHIPGTFQIGRKDRVWRNLQIQMARHGKKEFGFMPRTYVIPNDLKQLRRIWPTYSQRNVKWIIKPPSSARGTGIKVVNHWSQIPKRKPLIVQRYIERPLLINGSKFDLRLYVLVTSINPLRVYMHTDGLARFASVKYSDKADTLHDRYMHLTNYSINKLSANYDKNEDANACKGHKWTIKSLWTHLQAQGINVTGLWGALRNLVLRTILAGENSINHLTKMNMGSKYNCYELFGIDVILDSELKPWLLEVNISPSLHSASPLDLHVKGPLVQALLNTALFQVPPRIPLPVQHEIMEEQGLSGNLCYDKRIFVTNLLKTERAKHTDFTSPAIANREDYLKEILQNLTSDDIRCLMITEDELNRSAPLERIFPSPTSHKYMKFLENPRYYNRLLDAWEHWYSERRDDGIELLRKFCENKVHLIVPPVPVKKDCENKNNSTQDKQDQQPSPKEEEEETTPDQQQQQQNSTSSPPTKQTNGCENSNGQLTEHLPQNNGVKINNSIHENDACVLPKIVKNGHCLSSARQQLKESPPTKL